MFLFYFVNQSVQQATQIKRAVIQQKQSGENIKFYLDDAQFMMTQERYHNANFQYHKALEMNLTHTMANVGFVFSLSQLCVKEDRRCNELDSVFEKSFKRTANKKLFLDELIRLSLSADAKTKVILQDLINRFSN